MQVSIATGCGANTFESFDRPFGANFSEVRSMVLEFVCLECSNEEEMVVEEEEEEEALEEKAEEDDVDDEDEDEDEEEDGFLTVD